MRLALLVIMLAIANNLYAAEIHYSIFPSTSLKPTIAQTYGIPRSSNTAIITIALIEKGHIGGLKSNVSGEMRNLLQQKTALHFQEIAEDGVFYYLAHFYFTHRDILHFMVNMDDQQQLFTKTMWR